MSVDTRNLQGARASSAVRCIAKAEHEALGTPRTLDTPAYLERAFKRGVNVGRAWASARKTEAFAAMQNDYSLEIEAEIPWGLGWTGHVDLLDPNSKTVYEAYHAAGGAFREEKALQAAFYADELGPDWKAELAVIDTTDVHDEDGFSVQGYEINVDGLRERVRDIKRRVVAAVEAGEWNPADRVGDSPRHPECSACPFAQTCFPNWQPPAPQQVEGLEDKFVALKTVDADRKAKKASLKATEDLRESLIEQIAEVFPDESAAVTCGDVTVKKTHVAGGVTFSLTDATKAGYTLPSELAAYVKPRKGYDKWEVTP